jgi:hypothetical protein
MHLISDFSIWWLIPIVLVAAGITYFHYQNKGWFAEVKPNFQWLLRILRFSSLALIGILLLGLIIQSLNYREEKPVFIALVDNSSSMLNYKDSGSVRKNTTDFLAKLKVKYAERFELVTLTVGTEVDTENPKFQENSSALELGFEKINVDYYNRNIGGIAFISDGNYNVGANPSYAAEKISLTPVFTLAVGDTTPKKDHLIRNITVNDIAFLKNDFPVEVDLESFKIGARSVNVSIFQNGQKVGNQVVQYKNGKRDFQQANFVLNATKAGFQTYTVKLEAIDNEYTLKNNTRTFYIEVIDARSKVLILAGAPHPDIAALKEVLDANENIEAESVLLKDWNKSLDKVNLVIWHEPGVNFDQSTLDAIQAKKIPLFFVVGPNTTNGVLSKLNLGLAAAAGNQTDDNQAFLNPSFSSFEIDDKVADALTYYPPLKSKFGSLKMNGNAEILLYQRIGQIRKKEPLLFFLQQNNLRSGVLYGEGLWRWKLNDFVRSGNHDAFKELWSKVFNYLLVKQQGAGLRVEFQKRFTIDEDVIVNASFYNASLEPITKPLIDMKVTDEKGKVYRSQFGVFGSSYKLSLGKLKAGKYNWSAKASYDGKSYSKQGYFVVEDIQIEKSETTANHGVMKQLAKQSNGKFYQLNQYESLLSDIDKREDIANVQYEETAFNDLMDYFSIFLLLFLLLAGEWFLRRYLGSY